MGRNGNYMSEVIFIISPLCLSPNHVQNLDLVFSSKVKLVLKCLIRKPMGNSQGPVTGQAQKSQKL